MKKILSIILSLAMIISLVGCSTTKETDSSKKEEETNEVVENNVNDEEAQLEADKAELEAIGEVEVDQGLLFVKITLPADFAEGITQADLDAEAGSFYTTATLNSDGSVTYKMTKSQHKAMLASLTESFEEGFEEMVADETNTFTQIEHNKNFTVYDITLSSNEVGLTESFSVLAFYIYSGMYMIFSGDSSNVVINFYGEDGSLIESYDSDNAE